MGLRLNQISDEIAARSLARDTAKLSMLKGRGPLTSSQRDQENYLHTLGRLSFDVGMTLYRQKGSLAEVRLHLHQAGDFSLKEHLLRSKPAANTSRNPWAFKRLMEIVICWGMPAQRSGLGLVKHWQYRNPCHSNTEDVAAYIQLFSAHFIGKALDLLEIQRVVARLPLTGKASVDMKSLRLSLLALQALESNLVRDWTDAISGLLMLHGVECRSGDLRLSEEGHMCLPALMLARLGSERGWVCDLDSPYLPLDLIKDVPLGSADASVTAKRRLLWF